MLQKNNKDLSIEFLRCLSKIKGWHYHDNIEIEKNSEIRAFIALYILNEKFGPIASAKVSFKRINFFVEHPTFKPSIKALLILLQLSNNEQDFEERYRKCR